MITTGILLCAIFVLYINFKSYTKWFKSNSIIKREVRESMEKLEEIIEKPKLTMILFLIISSVPYLIFYVASISLFTEHIILLYYSVFLLVVSIISRVKGIIYILKDRDIYMTLISRILLPVNTLHLIAFFYYYLFQ